MTKEFRRSSDGKVVYLFSDKRTESVKVATEPKTLLERFIGIFGGSTGKLEMTFTVTIDNLERIRHLAARRNVKIAVAIQEGLALLKVYVDAKEAGGGLYVEENGEMIPVKMHGDS